MILFELYMHESKKIYLILLYLSLNSKYTSCNIQNHKKKANKNANVFSHLFNNLVIAFRLERLIVFIEKQETPLYKELVQM